jgi:hypothetical protein
VTVRRVVGPALLMGGSFLWPAPGLAGGPAGDAADRLDSPGSLTDRYLSSEEVRTILHANNTPLFDCFRTNLRGGVDPGETGVTFVIGRDGKAGQVVLESAHGPPALGTCIAGVLSAIAFPDHDGAPMEVAYPLVWQVDRTGARLLNYPVVFTRPRQVRVPLVALPPDLGDASADAVGAAITGKAMPPPSVPTRPPASVAPAALPAPAPSAAPPNGP